MTKKEINIVKACSKNINQFVKYVKILGPEGFAEFRPYQFQIKLLRKFVHSWENRRTEKHNHIVVGPRQSGKTTALAVYALWYLLFNSDKCIGLLGYKHSISEEILLRIKEIYSYLPDFLKQEVVRNTKEHFKLANGSYIFTAAMCARSVRGKTVDLLLFDEAAFTRDSDFEEFICSVFPTQASRPDSQMIMISTPHGGNQFYEIYKRAVSGNSSFIATRLRYDCVPGRDEKFKEKVIRDNGRAFFEQEYNASFVIVNEIPGDEKIVIKVNTNPLSPDEAKGFIEKLKKLYSKKLDIKTIKNRTEYEIEYI